MLMLELETRRFTFHAFHEDRASAYRILRRTVEKHLRQYDPTLSMRQSRQQAKELYSDDDVREVEFKIGTTLRDYDYFDWV